MMKKLIFAFAVIAITATTANAQDKTEATTSKPFMFSIGVEPSLPIGDFGDGYSFGIGGSLQGEYKVADDLGLTLNAGYITYSGKDQTFLGVTVKNPSFNVIPVLAGVKYYFGSGLFAHGQLGAGFASQKEAGETFSNTGFMYSPGIGYKFTDNFDAEVKYTGLSFKNEGSDESSTLNSIGLRVAYNF